MSRLRLREIQCSLLLVTLALACAGPRPKPDPLAALNRMAWRLDGLGPNQVSAGLESAAGTLLPVPVREAIGRLFENLAQPRVLVADLAQGRPLAAAEDLARLVVNSSVGLAGLFDVATPLGLARHDEDMGQALCSWGVPFGPYVYFPVLGPSSASEAVSITLDLALAPADLLLPQLAIHASRRRQLRAIREAYAEVGPGVDAYEFQRIAYRSDRLRQVRNEPEFVAPARADVRTPRAHGTCGYTR